MKKIGLPIVALLAIVLTACVGSKSEIYGKWILPDCQGNTCTVEFFANNKVNFFGVDTTYGWQDSKIVISPTHAGDTPSVFDPSIDGGRLKLTGSYSQMGKQITYYGFELERAYGQN